MTGPYADDAARWEAVCRRDPAAEGWFYYAVRSTGVYCRPSCPARRPRREHVRFFATAAEAEAAGFRPCRRCRPNQVPAEQQVVAQVLHLLQAADSPPALAELSQAVGLSPWHLQRLFKKATGLSPRAYADLTRAERLKEKLKAGATVTEALYEAGYGSPRALYEQVPRHLGMTPGTYRNGGEGERIAYGCFDTPLGRMLVAATERGLCALRFGDEGAMVAELQAEFPRAAFHCDPGRVEAYAEAVRRYLAEGTPLPELPLDLRGTAFQQRVWAALRAIPPGEVRSYQEVAAQIGAPAAMRAVGRACATNPVAVVVPCHRVVRQDGDLGGYRWGLERKRALLEHEARRFPQEGRRPRP